MVNLCLCPKKHELVMNFTLSTCESEEIACVYGKLCAFGSTAYNSSEVIYLSSRKFLMIPSTAQDTRVSMIKSYALPQKHTKNIFLHAMTAIKTSPGSYVVKSNP